MDPLRSGKKSANLGTLRDGLINKGMIYAPAHGDIAFTVPRFTEFMRRNVISLGLPGNLSDLPPEDAANQPP